MRLPNFLKMLNDSLPGRFLNEKELNLCISENLASNQTKLTDLHKDGILPESRKKLIYSFIHANINQATRLAETLQEQGFVTQEINEDFLEGVSSPVNMNLKDINDWTIQMCKRGYDFDCKFSFWDLKIEEFDKN